jgi:hypothetical protein
MIYKLDHIGITVPSLEQAREQLEAAHPCFHTQFDMETGSALREVSIHQPARFSISLHRKPNSISIELIEYGKVEPLPSSILPLVFSFEALKDGLPALKSVLRENFEYMQEQPRILDVLAQLSVHGAFNAVVIAVEDLESEEAFWTALRFRRIAADDEIAVLALASFLPPVETHYVVLLKAGYATARYTDAEGVNEIALLCSSCQDGLDSFPQNVSRTGASVFAIGGKEISLGYLRSPSGVLSELFSVKIPAN